MYTMLPPAAAYHKMTPYPFKQVNNSPDSLFKRHFN